ncbi:MAG: hypothetical protein LQ345_004119 [Seirophora villosa]|nr:MAG: hypothetical protein LQ345_004119 [Seirophora villosa]
MPVEVILTTLEQLPRRALKQARLVCREWADLGARALAIDTVYLSPRDKDMEHFDAITQHPIFGKTVKHLVFDSAQFVELSFSEYFTKFIVGLNDQALHQNELALMEELAEQDGMRDRDEDAREEEQINEQEVVDEEDMKHLDEASPVREATKNHASHRQRLIRQLGLPFTRSSAASEIFDRHAEGQFRSDKSLMDGFRQYTQLAKQQQNILSKTWFDRACQGLKAIRDLKSVTVCNAWSMIHSENFIPSSRQERYEMISRDDVDSERENLCVVSDDIDWYDDRNELFVDGEGFWEVEHASLLERYKPEPVCREEPYSALSPLARSWPSTWLLPFSPRYPLRNPKATMKSMGISDGSFEVLKLGQLLNAAGKQPLKIKLLGGWMGLSTIAFCPRRWPVSSRLASACGRLEVLDIKFVTRGRPQYDTNFLRLEGLRSIFHASTTLQKLSLSMLFGAAEFGVTEDGWYALQNIFPRGADWQLPKLRDLDLTGFAVSYERLAGLLFLDFPSLKELRLECIQLMSGSWDDFVEGLRHLDTLQLCLIREPLLQLTEVPNRHYQLYRGRWKTLTVLDDYINEGGRHPSLLDNEPDAASAKYHARLNETLDRLRRM